MVAWVKGRDLVHDTAITLGPGDTTGEALGLLPKRAHGAVVVVEGGRPVGVVTEADCQGVDRFTQLRQVMSTDLLTLRAGTDPQEAFGLLHDGAAPAGPGGGRDRQPGRHHDPDRRAAGDALPAGHRHATGGCGSAPRSASTATSRARPSS